jgi:hypothetical protein
LVTHTHSLAHTVITFFPFPSFCFALHLGKTSTSKQHYRLNLTVPRFLFLLTAPLVRAIHAKYPFEIHTLDISSFLDIERQVQILRPCWVLPVILQGHAQAKPLLNLPFAFRSALDIRNISQPPLIVYQSGDIVYCYQLLKIPEVL